MSSWRDLLSGLISLSNFSFNVLRKDKIDIALVIFQAYYCILIKFIIYSLSEDFFYTTLPELIAVLDLTIYLSFEHSDLLMDLIQMSNDLGLRF